MKKYNISGMSCAACSARIERAVSSLPGVVSCSVNLLTNSMTVEGSDDESIIHAVSSCGYGASVAGAKSESNQKTEEENHEVRTFAVRLLSSILLLLVLMYVSMGHVMWSFPLPSALEASPLAIALIQMIISAVVMIINGRFFVNGTRAVLKRAPNMDTLVALGSFASFVWSVGVVFKMCFAASAAEQAHSLHDLYFESAAMIVTLITLGKMLEAVAKGKTTNAIKNLLALTPSNAQVIRDGVEITIPTKDVRLGDILVVRPGQSFAVDGVVTKGESTVDESSLTGESIPLEKSVGANVFAASLNLSGYLEFKATKLGEDTLMGEVVKTVSDAAASKAPIAKMADRVSRIFVPLVLSLALLTTLVWFFINRDVGYSLARGISVLVISCPCALGLATPVAIMVGSGIGARGGVLFKSASAIEATGRAKIIALDKTGTVTQGKPEITDIIPFNSTENELLKIAASLEKKSEHPLAKAVLSEAEKRKSDLIETDEFEALSGSGVRAYIKGEEILGGSFDFISKKINSCDEIRDVYKKLSDDGKTPLFFTKGGKLIGVIAVADALKNDSEKAIRELQRMGLRIVMITGDNELTAKSIASRVGINEVFASLMPKDKSDAVRSLSAQGTCIMVGDGINDAPALTSADVGMAIGAGTDIAIESADAVLMGEGLMSLVGAVKLGRETLKNIKENLFWAFIYNIIGIPIAAGAFIPLGLTLNPMLAAAAMSISSFCVVMNALRLNTKNFFKKESKSSINTNSNLQNERSYVMNLKITGMMCPHCEARVKSVLEAIDGVKSAEVSHTDGIAVLVTEGEVEQNIIINAVENAGYKCEIA